MNNDNKMTYWSSKEISRRPALPQGLWATALQLCLAAAIVLACFCACAHAQTTNATIRGEVVDPTGAAIPHAQIRIQNQDTQVTAWRGFSDSHGAFVAPQVPTGTYTVTASAPGMKTAVLKNVIATVAQVVTVTVTLQIGTTSQQVIVSAHGEHLDRSSSNISTLISPADVQKLPLQDRKVFNLLTLVPGVAAGGSATSLTTSQLSINGSRTLNTDVLLDGVSIIDESTGLPATLPSPAAVDQFRALTLNAPAEFGRTSGAVLSVSSRSGTDHYHGSLYSLVRNEALDANSYFNNLQGVSRPRDRYYQFGAALGGPVQIPRIYDGRHRTFFFVNYDRTLELNPSTQTQTVPSSEFRSGNFSGATTKVYDPSTKQPFADNTIPASQIDPAAAAIMNRLPLPNRTGTFDSTNDRFTNNWVGLQTLSVHQTRALGRLDQQIGSKGHLSIPVYYRDNNSPKQTTFLDPILNTTYGKTFNDQWTASAHYTYIWSPTLVMELSYGYNRSTLDRHPTGRGADIKSLFSIGSLPVDQLPELEITGYSDMGAKKNSTQVNVTNTYSPFGSVTKVWGRHTIKVGAEFRNNEFNYVIPSGYPNGQLEFTGEMTNKKHSSGSAVNSLADFLLGEIKKGQYTIPQPEAGLRNYALGIYGQDDFRVSPKLTLNLGVRYEYESPITVSNNYYSRFDPDTGKLLAAGLNASRTLNLSTPRLDFAPRIGFAYSPIQGTVIRGAFGNFYGPVFANLGGTASPGFSVETSFGSKGKGKPQAFSLSQGIPLVGVRDLTNPFAILDDASPSHPVSGAGNSFNNFDHLALVQQWNFGIQQQLPDGFIMEINYVANRGLHLPTTIPVNLVPMDQATEVALADTQEATQEASPFPDLQSWSVTENVGTSSYNSLQATLRRQLGSQLTVLANYTWGKSLDDASTIFPFSVPSGNTSNAQYAGSSTLRKQDWAYSDFDVRNTFNLGLTYTTGGPRWMKGFTFAPLFVARSGFPLNVTQSNLFPSVTTQRPNGDSSSLKLDHPVIDGSVVRWFKQPTDSSFPLTPSGPLFVGDQQVLPTALGTLSRNSVRAPGSVTLDFSLSRSFSIYHEGKFVLRIDAFNLLNHTNFDLPNTSLTVSTDSNGNPIFNSSDFGTIDSAQDARQLQIEGKIFF